MFSKKYRLIYLPLFYDDLDEKVTYIAEKLKNPNAANDLLDKVESAIMERLPAAESFEPYYSVRERRYSYYRIYVDKEREYLELQTRARTIQAQTGTYWWCERGEENLPCSIVELIRM